MVAGTVARPYVNFTEFAGDEYGQIGWTALKEGRCEDAVRYLRLALYRRGGSSTWYNLSIAYEELERWDEAAEAFQTACSLTRDYKGMQQALAHAKRKLAHKAGHAGDEDTATRFDDEARGPGPRDDDVREDPLNEDIPPRKKAQTAKASTEK